MEQRTLFAVDAGLVALYAMAPVQGSVVVADQSGSGNDAAIVDSPLPLAGPVGPALDFSPNSSDRLVASNSDTLDITSQITLSAWVRPDVKRQSMVVVKKATFDSVDGYELGLSNNGKVFFRLNQASSGNRFRVDSTSSYPSDAAKWMHVVGTYDGRTLRIYINGKLEASKRGRTSIVSNNVGLSVGGEVDGFRTIDGAIDDVRVYNRAVSASEVDALFEMTEAGETPVITPTPDPTTGPVTDPTTNPPTDPTDPAPDPSPTVEEALSLLFYGNSFTNGYQKGKGDVTPVPELLSEIAVAAGHPAPTIVNKSLDGKDLSYALSKFSASSVDPSLDYVVFQEYSTKPTDIKYENRGDAAEFKSDVAGLFAEINAIAPDALPVLYETWAQPPMATTDLKNYYPALSATAAANKMQAELQKYYAQAATVLDQTAGDGATRVAPVGDAFQDDGLTGLFSTDNHHASNAGYALSALVMYDTIYQTTADGVYLNHLFSSLGISVSQGARLVAVADSVAGGV